MIHTLDFSLKSLLLPSIKPFLTSEGYQTKGWDEKTRGGKLSWSSFFFTVLTYLVTFNRLLWHHKRSREEQRCSMVAVLGSCFLVFNQYLLTVFRLKDIFLFQKKYLQKKQFLAYLINQTIYTFFQSFPWHSLIRHA